MATLSMPIKTRKIDAGTYEVVGTRLHIVKGEPPRYRAIQEWYVIDSRNSDFMFTARSLHGAVTTLTAILDACSMITADA